MTKANLVAGMMVVTENGVARLVMPTKNDGLILVSQDNKALKVSKLNDDLTRNRYKAGNDVVKVYDIMDGVNSELFTTVGRDLLFDRYGNGADVDSDVSDGCSNCDCNGTCCGCNCDDDYDDDDYDADDTAGADVDAGFTKNSITPGMLAVTRDGKNRLAIPTGDMGMVLAAQDSKHIRLDKMNDDLTIAGYRNPGKNVDEVYGLASGVTTDFYSKDNRPLLFKRDAE